MNYIVRNIFLLVFSLSLLMLNAQSNVKCDGMLMEVQVFCGKDTNILSAKPVKDAVVYYVVENDTIFFQKYTATNLNASVFHLTTSRIVGKIFVESAKYGKRDIKIDFTDRNCSEVEVYKVVLTDKKKGIKLKRVDDR